MIASTRTRIVARKAETPYRYRAWIIVGLALIATALFYAPLWLLGGFS